MTTFLLKISVATLFSIPLGSLTTYWLFRSYKTQAHPYRRAYNTLLDLWTARPSSGHSPQFECHLIIKSNVAPQSITIILISSCTYHYLFIFVFVSLLPVKRLLLKSRDPAYHSFLTPITMPST